MPGEHWIFVNTALESLNTVSQRYLLLLLALNLNNSFYAILDIASRRSVVPCFKFSTKHETAEL